MRTISKRFFYSSHIWLQNHQELSTTLQISLAGTDIHPARWLSHFQDEVFPATLALNIQKQILRLLAGGLSAAEVSTLEKQVQDDLNLYEAYEGYILEAQKAIQYYNDTLIKSTDIQLITQYLNELNGYRNMAVLFGSGIINQELKKIISTLESIVTAENKSNRSKLQHSTYYIIPSALHYCGDIEKNHPYLIKYIRKISPPQSNLDHAHASAQIALSGGGFQASRDFLVHFHVDSNRGYIFNNRNGELDADTRELPLYFFQSTHGLAIDQDLMPKLQKESYIHLTKRFSETAITEIFSLYFRFGFNAVGEKYPQLSAKDLSCIGLLLTGVAADYGFVHDIQHAINWGKDFKYTVKPSLEIIIITLHSHFINNSHYIYSGLKISKENNIYKLKVINEKSLKNIELVFQHRDEKGQSQLDVNYVKAFIDDGTHHINQSLNFVQENYLLNLNSPEAEIEFLRQLELRGQFSTKDNPEFVNEILFLYQKFSRALNHSETFKRAFISKLVDLFLQPAIQKFGNASDAIKFKIYIDQIALVLSLNHMHQEHISLPANREPSNLWYREWLAAIPAGVMDTPGFSGLYIQIRNQLRAKFGISSTD